MSRTDQNASAHGKPDQRLRKTERLRLGSEFRKLRFEGRRYDGRCMILYVLESSGPSAKNSESSDAPERPARVPVNRVGLSVSRKLGNAVARNRARRLLRESWRLNKQKLNNNLQVMIVARSAIRGKSLQEIESELVKLLGTAGAVISS